MREPLDDVTIRRAAELIERGHPLQEVARMLGVSRSSLYNYGLRSLRGYYRR